MTERHPIHRIGAPRCCAIRTTHVEEPTPCRARATERVDGLPFCWLHASAWLNPVRSHPLAAKTHDGPRQSPHTERA